jgi:Hemerythrin HHE cation binding domain
VDPFPELYEEHRRLETQAERLREIVMAPVADAAAIAGMRWQMAQALHGHCTREDEAIYQTIFASGDGEATRAAWAYRKQHGRISRVFGDYIGEWPVTRINREWEAFRTATLAVLDQLAARIASEEDILYSHALRVRTRRAA